MFIPIEYAYFAALKADKDLNAYAKSKKVAIVTPSNLFSVMQVVEQLWRVERTLTAADKAYTEADKALRGNQGIIKAAAHLEELGVNHKKTSTPYLENNP